MRLFKAFRSSSSGMTTIEYALLAGVMGTGVVMSLTYVSEEMTAMIQPNGCTWEAPQEGVDDGRTRCVGAPGWSPRRAQPPRQTLTASSSN